jgi:hypothetical protein
MPKVDAEPMKQVSIYLPMDVAEIIRKRAKKNERSLNKEVSKIVRDYIEQEAKRESHHE